MRKPARLYTTLAAVVSGIMYYTASAHGVEPEGGSRLSALQARYVGVQLLKDRDGGVALYGGRMTAAGSPGKAAAGWIAENASGMFSTPTRPTFNLVRTNQVGRGDRAVYAYQQMLEGLPVEYGVVRLMTQPIGGFSVVVYASGNLTEAPPGGFRPIRIDEITAVDLVRGMRRYSHLPNWSKPELAVIEAESGRGRSTVRAWKFYGEQPVPEKYEAYAFFIDAASGDLVHVRDEVYQAEVSGTVRGLATPGTLPDTTANPPVLFVLPHLTVEDGIGSGDETDVDGVYLFDTAAASIGGALEGPFVVVRNQQGADLLLNQSLVAAGPTDFLFNSVPLEFGTAQVNAFIHANAAHDFYTGYQPEFGELDRQIEAQVNIDSICNALFTPLGPTIKFFNAGSCVNTAYSSVIAHEYGHFIVSQLGLRQGSFGEGFGDTFAMLLYDDEVVGRDFQGPGTFVRNPAEAQQQYPCFAGIHDCGQTLGGVWWDLKLGLQQSLGAEAGLETARQLFTDWSQITVGIRFGRNSATPLTAVEVLAVDDDDADLANGTPHQGEICSAFVAHGVACPNDCESVSAVNLRCRRGTFRLSATVVTEDAAGSEYELLLDSADAQAATIGSFGRGTVRWSDVAPGLHEVCITGCDLCESIACE